CRSRQRGDGRQRSGGRIEPYTPAARSEPSEREAVAGVPPDRCRPAPRVHLSDRGQRISTFSTSQLPLAWVSVRRRRLRSTRGWGELLLRTVWSTKTMTMAWLVA